MKLTSIQTGNMNINTEKLEAQIYDMAVRSGMFVPVDSRTFRYKRYMILRGPDDRWNVFLMPTKQLIASTFLKVTAFALVKMHEKKMSHRMQELEDHDLKFQKNYNDSVFYKNTMNVSKDSIRRDNALWRYELVNEKVKSAKSQIDRIFYSSLA
jgi:hypothetical protein